MGKIRKPSDSSAPAYLCGRFVFEFFNNDDLEFKNESLKRIAKALRKDFNVSVCTVRDTLLEDPERAVMAVALVAPSKSSAQELAEKVLAFLDGNMPGRLIQEDWTGEEF